MGLGIEMAVAIVICMYAGYRMDRWLETAPWFFLAGAFLGIAIGFYNLFRRVMPPRRKPDGEQR
jgi:F0F1-type ATP synthase assembly protein I